MKIKSSLHVTLAITAVLLLLSGCNKAPVRTDAQVATDVQNKINSDSAVVSREVGVQAANGIVTLSGNVGQEEERTAAAHDAATVEGVKTVINNLVVQQAQAAPPPVAEPPSVAPCGSTDCEEARQASPASPRYSG